MAERKPHLKKIGYDRRGHPIYRCPVCGADRSGFQGEARMHLRTHYTKAGRRADAERAARQDEAGRRLAERIARDPALAAEVARLRAERLQQEQPA